MVLNLSNTRLPLFGSSERFLKSWAFKRIRGIGGSLIYLVDRFGDRSIYDVDFAPAGKALRKVHGVGLTHIDHLTHNVHKGRMDQWELRLRLQDSKKVT